MGIGTLRRYYPEVINAAKTEAAKVKADAEKAEAALVNEAKKLDEELTREVKKQMEKAVDAALEEVVKIEGEARKVASAALNDVARVEKEIGKAEAAVKKVFSSKAASNPKADEEPNPTSPDD